MKKLNYAFLCACFLLAITSSCKKELTPEQNSSTLNQFFSIPSADTSSTVLGKKLENPYTVTNMKLAFSKLKSGTGTLSTSTDPVRLTHLYIRFLPKDTTEYDILVRDSTLKLYTTPLDYEIVKQGNYYHDPALSNQPFTWLYASVASNYSFSNNIQYELIDSLYIPEEDPNLGNSSERSTQAVGSGNSVNFTDALLNQAMLQTHNFEYIKTKGNVNTTLYNPKGTIRTFDTALNRPIPLQGVKIRIRRWFTTRIEYTDQQGEYETATSFSGPVNYYLFFETSRFDVRTGWFGQASIDGPKQKSPWNVDISANSVERFYADVFRGAWRYWYGDIGGLYRPTVFNAIKYAARDNNTTTSSFGVTLPGAAIFGLFPQIYMSRRVNNRIVDSDEVFSATVHETAHYTHYRNITGLPYYIANHMIQESWATAVELFLTKREYQARGFTDFGEPNYPHPHQTFPLNFGYQQSNAISGYTPLFIDLVDNINQRIAYSSIIDDTISGYTMPQLEIFLGSAFNENQLTRELKSNKPAGVTDLQIDQFLNQFEF